jgi:hypothetical protein
MRGSNLSCKESNTRSSYDSSTPPSFLQTWRRSTRPCCGLTALGSALGGLVSVSQSVPMFSATYALSPAFLKLDSFAHSRSQSQGHVKVLRSYGCLRPGCIALNWKRAKPVVQTFCLGLPLTFPPAAICSGRAGAKRSARRLHYRGRARVRQRRSPGPICCPEGIYGVPRKGVRSSSDVLFFWDGDVIAWASIVA